MTADAPEKESNSADLSPDAGGGSVVLRFVLLLIVIVVAVTFLLQQRRDKPYQPSAEVGQLGTIEVTARLAEVPGKFLPNDNFYNYVFVMKYEVEAVHRGELQQAQTDEAGKRIIYVGHYNPLKPRDKVADDTVENIGGHLPAFEVGHVHRLALDVPIDEHYIGGIINRFAKRPDKPKVIYWGRWTEREH